MSPTTLREVAKAYLHGAIISYTSAQKEKALKIQLELEKKIKELEGDFKMSPSQTIQKQLDATRSALNQLLTKKAESSVFFAEHRLYESSNKPGRLLAHLARGGRNLASISVLQDTNGVRFQKSTEINSMMKAFYQRLCSSDRVPSEETKKRFLGKIKLPTLSDDQKKDLCTPITEKEVLEIIKVLKGGKLAGPDGYCPDFYKKLGNIFVGLLTDMYRDSFGKG